jgi:2'-5' RNA ligase
MDLYFIALIPPDEINDQVLKWKLWMKDNLDCVVALRSPGHVTLVPPFRMKKELEDPLFKKLDEFASDQNSFLIRLSDFSHFRSRVIYIHVKDNPELNRFRNDLFDFLQQEPRFPIPAKEEKYTAHITIATRDLDKYRFQKAWEYFKEIGYQADWLCRNISLLRHNKKNWDVITTAQFKD